MPTPLRFAWVLALLLAAGPASVWAQCADGDGDGLCDAVDPCTNVEGITVRKPFLRQRKVQVAGDQSTRFFFVGTLTVPTDPPIDPMSNGIRLVVRNPAEDPLGTVTIDVTLPPGAFDSVTDRGWSVSSSGTYLYRDEHGMYAHILRALVKPLDSGELKISVFGQNGSYPLPHLPPEGTIVATVVVDSPVATTGQCGEVVLTDCRYRNQGDKLLCL